MKTLLLTAMIFVFLSPALFAQKKDEPVKTKPGEQITVNKQYDDEGNLIRFDSTYTYEWHGDTMMASPDGNFHFPPDNIEGFGNIFDGFFPDSLHRFPPFGNEWGKEMFKNHEEFLKHFHQPFDNPDFFNGFSFNPDSLHMVPWNDSTFNFHFNFDKFGFPDMSEFFKQFDQSDNPGQQFFNNGEQEKEWNELMKKQQKEQDEFQRKWDLKNKSKAKDDPKSQKI
jgi:hypothetical protein